MTLHIEMLHQGLSRLAIIIFLLLYVKLHYTLFSLSGRELNKSSHEEMNVGRAQLHTMCI